MVQGRIIEWITELGGIGGDCLITADEPPGGAPWEGRYIYDPAAIPATVTHRQASTVNFEKQEQRGGVTVPSRHRRNGVAAAGGFGPCDSRGCKTADVMGTSMVPPRQDSRRALALAPFSPSGR
jgi:hypothetical protein